MKRRCYLRMMFAVLVTMGLLVAPLAGSAIAKGVAMSTAQMSGDMPCCPDGDGDQKDTCKDCPSMVACNLQGMQALPIAVSRADFGFSPFDRIVATDDFNAANLSVAPPARPPRS